jgi:hypothetical protein
MGWSLCISLALAACAQGSDQAVADGNVDGMAIHSKCLSGSSATTKTVTHYYVPLLDAYDHYSCDQMEGTCIYKKNGVEWLHNYGYADQKLKDARCKNGYGNKSNCLNPCRTIAASMSHHRWGEIIYIKELVGQKCGSARDKTDMIHDGFVMVGDTGSPTHFNAPGRFDFFWGRCKNKTNGVCHEGAVNISSEITTTPYCKVWNPVTPALNSEIREAFFETVKQEALRRGDLGAAAEL